MKSFIVFVGVLALLAFSQAQSDDSENVTAPEDDGESSSPAPPAPGPPGRPGHPGKPGHDHPVRPGHPGPHGPRPRPGIQVGPDGWSFNAPGISIHIGRPGRHGPPQEPEQGSPSRRPILHLPVFLDSLIKNNRIEGGVNNRASTTAAP